MGNVSIDAPSLFVEQRSVSARWKSCRRIVAEGRAALRAEASQEMAAPPQLFGDPVGTEEVRRLQHLVENLPPRRIPGHAEGTRTPSRREHAERCTWCIWVRSLPADKPLKGAALARGDNTTLSQLRDQSRRPVLPREALREELACFVPEQDFVLEEGWFSHNLRKARRGAGEVFTRVTPRRWEVPFSVCFQDKIRVAHIQQVLTELDPSSTVVSVDGIGAYDLMSRNAMMRGLRHVVEGDRILPFVRAFYGKPSSYIWEDDVGDVHQIAQGEGGEQGDPLMPLLFCIGQHPALAGCCQRVARGRESAYLDDLCIICHPDRVGEVHALLQQHLWNYTGISLHSGKTKVWNRSGVEPAGVSELQRQAEVATPGAIVWRGDTSLPWLILSYCASAKSNFFLRRVSPAHSGDFARSHDEGIWRCFRQILELSPDHRAEEVASLPLRGMV